MPCSLMIRIHPRVMKRIGSPFAGKRASAVVSRLGRRSWQPLAVTTSAQLRMFSWDYRERSLAKGVIFLTKSQTIS